MNWLVASTQPNCEGVAARDLALVGVESVAPRYRDHLLQPRLLFPGYLFVLAALELARTVAPRARGVARVIGEMTHAQLEPWLSYQPEDEFYPGRSVQLRRLGEVHGMVDGYGADDRIRVLYRMLGREVRSEFERVDLVLG